jgi:hypothetical protein
MSVAASGVNRSVGLTPAVRQGHLVGVDASLLEEHLHNREGVVAISSLSRLFSLLGSRRGSRGGRATSRSPLSVGLAAINEGQKQYHRYRRQQ